MNMVHASLQKRLAYTFKQTALLTQALTHRSYGLKNNERFELLGDAVFKFYYDALVIHTFS